MSTPPHRFPWLPVLYLLFGVSWIFASDSVIGWLFGGSAHLLLVASTIKGFAFIALTALILGLWWRAEHRRTTGLLQGAEARAGFATERLAWMARHANDVILLLDDHGRILDCNDRAESTYGYAREELLQLDVFALRVPGAPEDARRIFRTVLERGSRVFSTHHARRDGSAFPVQVSSNRVEFEGRVYVQSIVRDQSELVAARRRIERQRDLYDLLSRCNHVAARLRDRQSLFDDIVRLAVEHGRFLFACIVETRADGTVVRVSNFGDDGGYLEPVHLQTHPEDPTGQGPAGQCVREGVTVVCNRFLEDPRTRPWHELGHAVGVQGVATVPIRLRGAVIGALIVHSGEPDFFEPDIVQTLEEITGEIQFGLEALETRKELEESRNLLQSVIDASATPVYAFDREGRALLLNEACTRVFGGTRGELLGRTRDTWMSPGEAAAKRAADQAVFASGEPLVTEESVGSGAAQRAFLTIKYPLRDLTGAIYAVGGVSTDITDLRRAQRNVMEANARLEETVGLRTRELVAARDRAEMADRSKTAFLSTVSHELRTPLNSIIGFTDVVLQELSGPLNEEQKRQLGIVQESSRMLLGLINEILDLSRIEAGRLQLDFESFDLSELLRKRVEAFASIAEQKRIALECRVDDTVGIIFSDPKRVAQIVTNLLSNATKFTVAGSVALHARRVHDNVEIDVRDTGPGICSDDLALLFRPFMQVGEAQRSHREGTGLGLVISRHLAHALGGDIGVSSVVGQGTVFTITLPVRSSPQPDDLGDTGLFHKLVTPA